MQNRGTFCLKKYFNMERSKGIFVREILRNTIVNENVLNSEGSLMYYQVCPSDYLFQLSLSYCKVDQKKTVAISQIFIYVQLYGHWMHLFNTRICRYTYITPTLIFCDKDR